MIKRLAVCLVVLAALSPGCGSPVVPPHSPGPLTTAAQTSPVSSAAPSAASSSAAATTPAGQSATGPAATAAATQETSTTPAPATPSTTPAATAVQTAEASTTTAATHPAASTAGASATADATADTTAKPGQTIFLIKTSNMFSNTQLQVVAVLTDAGGAVMNFDGVVSARMWQNPDPTLIGKGELLQQWDNISLTTADHFEEDLGKWIAFDFYGFYPKEVQSVYLDVTLTTGGSVYVWEGKMPLTTEAA